MTQLEDSPVWGATAIGQVIGLPPKATYTLLEKGILPARKIGGRWVGIPSRLRAYVADSDDSEP